MHSPEHSPRQIPKLGTSPTLPHAATPLRPATENREAEVVALLLGRGADPSRADGDGTIPPNLARRLDAFLDRHLPRP